jgi:RNA polymerase sigma-70 factor (ECF subfamily)
MISAEARGAWSEIESRLRPYVTRRVATASDADDVIQEIFVRIHAGIGALRDSERFGAWIYRIAEHVLADFARARQRDPLARRAEPESPSAEDEVPHDVDSLQEDLGQCVALFASRLPSPYREAITLTELQGLTQKDAAEVLGISLSAMKSRVQRGREKIRHMFEECCLISLDARGRVIACDPRPLHEIPEDCRAAASAWANRGVKLRT